MSGPRKPAAEVLVAENRRARRDYSIIETLECGLELRGSEVKSLRLRRVGFADAYAIVNKGQLQLVGLRIDRWVNQSMHVEVGPARTRRLLAHKREIVRLGRMLAEGDYTLVPLRLYFKGPWAKVLLGLAEGKSYEDKREDIKKREADREMSRALTRLHQKR